MLFNKTFPSAVIYNILFIFNNLSNLFFLQIPLQIVQSDQVFPDHTVGLGGGWAAGLSSGIQHVEPAHSQKEPQLLALGLQLQFEASQNSNHKGIQ